MKEGRDLAPALALENRNLRVRLEIAKRAVSFARLDCDARALVL